MNSNFRWSFTFLFSTRMDSILALRKEMLSESVSESSMLV